MPETTKYENGLNERFKQLKKKPGRSAKLFGSVNPELVGLHWLGFLFRLFRVLSSLAWGLALVLATAPFASLMSPRLSAWQQLRQPKLDGLDENARALI